MKNAKDWSLSVNDFQFGVEKSGTKSCHKGRKTSSLQGKPYISLHLGHQPAPRKRRRPFAMFTLAQKVRQEHFFREGGRLALDQDKTGAERREWVRLPIAIPVFIRSRDQSGKDSLEFATALNISAGGALVAVHRALRPAAQVSLEIPSAPLAAAAPAPKSSRNLKAKIVRITHADGYHLLGLKFSQPLLSPPTRRAASRR